MPRFPYRKAGRFWKFVLGRFGFIGVTMPWAIYILPEFYRDRRLMRHEFAHVRQMRRDGVVVWFFKASYYIVRFGYWRSPYEIEARQHAD